MTRRLHLRNEISTRTKKFSRTSKQWKLSLSKPNKKRSMLARILERRMTLNSEIMDSSTSIMLKKLDIPQRQMKTSRTSSLRPEKKTKKRGTVPFDKLYTNNHDSTVNTNYEITSSYKDPYSNINFFFAEDSTSFNDSSKLMSTRIQRQNSIQYRQYMYDRINEIRYRGNVFKAASQQRKEMPPYPDWTYKNENIKSLNIKSIDVGGRIFQIFEETLLNLKETKLSKCISKHRHSDIPFLDRDPECFAAVLQFYRTGQLHKPFNVCHSFFEEELEFWGVNDKFMEPCCWSIYDKVKVSSNTIKKYSEDVNKGEVFDEGNNGSAIMWRRKIYMTVTSGSEGVLSRWFSMVCTIFIIASVVVVTVSPSSIARIDRKTQEEAEYIEGEFLMDFLARTDVKKSLSLVEVIITGYFLSELIIRLILCPNKLDFFSNTLNWVDLVATVSSFLSMNRASKQSKDPLEGYLLLLKLPRILRLFKLTTSLRSGMEAFILTLRASAIELRLVFLILFISTTVFGSLFFVIEMVNETTFEKSRITNIYLGMWLAIVTMSTVGYGDIHIKSVFGYLLGATCIMCGVIICQLPVPIFLQNFRIYYNQATARLNNNSRRLKVREVDPESIANTKGVKVKDTRMFSRLFRS